MSAFVYSPYGCIGEQTPRAAMIGFNGDRYDPPTGTYALGQGYRNYSPALMRFYSPDDLSPFGEGGYNAYAYCAGDPLNYWDDTGQSRMVARLKLFWKIQSGRPIQQVAPRTTTPAVQVKGKLPLKVSPSTLPHETRRKTVSFNPQPQTYVYPKEQIANKDFLRQEKQSLDNYIERFNRRVQRNQRMLAELNDPSTLKFVLSKGFNRERYNIVKLELEVWLEEAQSRIRNLRGTARSFNAWLLIGIF